MRTVTQEQIAAKMPERALQENIRSLALQLGIRYYHTHNSRHSPAGFPDCVLLCPPRSMFRELKRQGNQLTAPQVAWLTDLTHCGYDVGVWRPIDWISGRIQRELVALKKGPA